MERKTAAVAAVAALVSIAASGVLTAIALQSWTAGGAVVFGLYAIGSMMEATRS